MAASPEGFPVILTSPARISVRALTAGRWPVPAPLSNCVVEAVHRSLDAAAFRRGVRRSTTLQSMYNPPMSKKVPMVRRTFLRVGGAAALGHSLSSFRLAAQASNASGIKVEKDVVVGKGGDTELHCDIYSPPVGTGKRMALVHFHGGGFARGSKDTLASKLLPITARGYVSVAAQYRLSGVAKWPSQIDDAKTHIRWVRTNANLLGIDPNRIGVVGYSAGGHIALFTAGQSDAEITA